MLFKEGKRATFFFFCKKKKILFCTFKYVCTSKLKKKIESDGMKLNGLIPIGFKLIPLKFTLHNIIECRQPYHILFFVFGVNPYTHSHSLISHRFGKYLLIISHAKNVVYQIKTHQNCHLSIVCESNELLF